MSEKRRVVVTGMGAVTALGMDVPALWENMIAGNTGVKRITSFDPSELKSQNGAEIDSDKLNEVLKENKIRPMERVVDFALLASAQALKQAGLFTNIESCEPQNIASIFGTGAGSTYALTASYMSFAEKGAKGIRPTTVPRCMASAISSHVSMKFRLTGPNYVLVSACSSATASIGTGYRMIRDGYANMVLSGGSETILDEPSFIAWNNLGVVSRNPDPAAACRPFDSDRDGCVLGEGAGALMLESLESARERGADIMGEICGYGESSDALHITSPNSEGQAKAILSALESAELTPNDIGFINAHGTATRANDECESISIRSALGSATDSIPVASNKSFFGHTLGASGAVETIVTLKGLQQGIVPPNLNLDNQDPKCDLNCVGKKATKIESPIAMKNSFGFGGNNCVLILKKWG